MKTLKLLTATVAFVLLLFVSTSYSQTDNTVKITIEWMAKNLSTSTFRNGEPIPEAKTNEEWQKAGDEGKPAWCYYNNDPTNGKKYGKLYNWYAVNDARGLAPQRWHVATDKEWQFLVDYLGGSAIAGAKMKEAGTSHWQSPNAGATNESGFSALPGGYRSNYGHSSHLGLDANFWSSSESSSASAWRRKLGYDYSGVNRYESTKRGGFSVRCVRD